MYRELLKRENESGVYRVLYLSEEHAHGEPSGIYADVARYDGTGYSLRCGSYVQAAHKVFREYGEFPEYAEYPR